MRVIVLGDSGAGNALRHVVDTSTTTNYVDTTSPTVDSTEDSWATITYSVPIWNEIKDYEYYVELEKKLSCRVGWYNPRSINNVIPKKKNNIIHNIRNTLPIKIRRD